MIQAETQRAHGLPPLSSIALILSLHLRPPFPHHPSQSSSHRRRPSHPCFSTPLIAFRHRLPSFDACSRSSTNSLNLVRLVANRLLKSAANDAHISRCQRRPHLPLQHGRTALPHGHAPALANRPPDQPIQARVFLARKKQTTHGSDNNARGTDKRGWHC